MEGGGWRPDLLLESVGDLQLHQQDALPHVQLLVQVLKVGVDVLLHGSSLIGQLLEDLPDQDQRLGDLGQSGTQVGAAACVAMTTEGPKGEVARCTCDPPALRRGQGPLQAAALLLQPLVQGQCGVVLVVRNTVLTQRPGTGGAVQVGDLEQGRDKIQLLLLHGGNDVPHAPSPHAADRCSWGAEPPTRCTPHCCCLGNVDPPPSGGLGPVDTPPYSQPQPAEGGVDAGAALRPGNTPAQAAQGGNR